MSSFTIISTEPQKYNNITNAIPQQVMTLKSFKVVVPTTYTGNYLNVRFGNVIGNKHIIDTDAGFDYLKIVLSKATVVGGNYETIAYPDISFTMSGDLEKDHFFTVMDENHSLLTNLGFIMLQFQLEF